MVNYALPYAVILDIAFAGYGALRSLFDYKIPLIGFYNSKTIPERYTRLCNRKIFYNDSDELLQLLIQISDSLDKKPVLILTSDFYVEFFVENREILSDKFLIHMPDSYTVDLLMDKNKFSAYAEKHNILIPESFKIRSMEDIVKYKPDIRFPVIVKPHKRTERWMSSKCKKAYIISEYKHLIALYEKVSNYESYLIIQDYIEGNDDQIEYCLVYFSKKSECLLAFTGKKIRQWPVGTGSTATTIPTNNNFIKEETKRIFKAVHYVGFGSIEYKLDVRNGKYYLIEPTVGRLNQQEFVATLSGYNIPLIAYSDLTDIEIIPNERINSDIIYIDEVAEFYSVFVHFKRKLLSVKQWRHSLNGHRYYRFANLKDKGVLWGLFIKALLKLFPI